MRIFTDPYTKRKDVSDELLENMLGIITKPVYSEPYNEIEGASNLRNSERAEITISLRRNTMSG